MIPYGKHFLDEDDIQAVVDVLRNGWLTQGPKVHEFEERLAAKVRAKYAVAVSSGTAALHLACMIADLDKDSQVFTSVNTFVASANCALYVGAQPKFCDIDETSLNMCPEDLEERLLTAGHMDAVIPVHFAGAPCDMLAIQSLAKKYDAIVIEDASHALGGQYETGEPIGSCVYSDMTVFSLHPVKGVTAGEGGVITTNNKKIYQRLLQLRSHGICKGNFDLPGISIGDDTIINTAEALYQGKLNPWYYEMQVLGYNYRITDIQCALATSQLRKLDQFIERRREIASKYDVCFADKELLDTTQNSHRKLSSQHLYVLRVDFEKADMHRASLMEKLFAEGVGTQVHYMPIPMHPYYESRGYKVSNYPVAEQYYREALSIPIFYGLTDEMLDKIVYNIEVALA